MILRCCLVLHVLFVFCSSNYCVAEYDEVKDFAENVLEMLPPIVSEAKVPAVVNSAGQDLETSPLKITKRTASQRSSQHRRYISCKVCSKTIEYCKQDRHSRIHTGCKPHICVECGKGYSRTNILRVHQRIDSSEQPYECKECGERFAHVDLMSEHMRLHKGEIYTCTHCGKTFTRAELLHSHMLVHSGQKNLECPQSSCSSVRADYLQSHMKTHNQDGIGEHALTGFMTSDGHTRHPRAPYVCHICNRTFPLACRLRAHVRLHSGEKNFTCFICGKQFALAYGLLLHMRVHTGEKPYQCAFCEKLFARRHNLKQHMRSHTGEKPYGCDICGKRYTQTKTLKEHMRVHTGERPFACPTCGKTFTRIDNLKVG